MAVRLVDDVGVAHSAAEALALELWNLSGCLKTANEPATEQVASLAGEWLNNILNAYESGLPAFEKVHESMGPGNSSDKARRMSVAELRLALARVDGAAPTVRGLADNIARLSCELRQLLVREDGESLRCVA